MKDVVIKITGTQNYNGQEDEAIELVTEGKYHYAHGRGEAYYSESELTGLEGTRTYLFMTPAEVILRREGTVTSSTAFRPGERSAFLYDTPYGSATMGVDTRSINFNLNENGGDMAIDYVIDMDHAVFGRNTFRINVREQEAIQP